MRCCQLLLVQMAELLPVAVKIRRLSYGMSVLVNVSKLCKDTSVESGQLPLALMVKRLLVGVMIKR